MKQIILNNEPTVYFINEQGKLYNQKTKHWYKGSISGEYLKYDLVWNNKKYPKFAHRLVAEYYLDNPNNLPVVNHKDGNKLNNNIENLEWVTYSENNYHAYKFGLKKYTNRMVARIKESELNSPDKCQWKQYQDTNYYLSDSGQAKNIKTGNILKGKITKNGYIEWCFIIQGKKKSLLAHRIIYETFIGPLDKNLVINHKNGNKQDNSIQNLEQITHSKNIIHSYYSVGHANVKQVGKYDLNNNLIEVYQSCADAARKNPGTYSNLISNVCNGKKNTHKGYIWKYLDKE